MDTNCSFFVLPGGGSSSSVSKAILLAVALGFQIACWPSLSLSQTWSIFVVDSSGIRPSIGVDSDGQPHLVYFDYVGFGGPRLLDSTRVKHATWDFGAQGFLAETTLVAPVNMQADLEMDRTNAPHATFHHHAPHGDPVHSFLDGSTWVHEMIPTAGHDGFSASPVLDSADRPHVSFVDAESSGSPDGPGVEYAYYDGAEWIVEAVGSERNLNHFTGTSIALDNDGSPAISYYDSVRHQLALAKKVNGEWVIEVVDSSGDAGRYSSLSFDSKGLPRIAYLQVLPSGLGVIRVAIANASGWTFMSIDTLYYMSIRRQWPESMISLQIDPSDVSYVAYSDTKVVKLVVLDGKDKNATVLDVSSTERTLGQSTSMVLDPRNVPHIAFFEDLGDSLGICFYATLSDRLLPPCDQIDAFAAKCNANGAAQAMVKVFNSTVFAGATLEVQLDDTVYPVLLFTNGTHTIGRLQVPQVGYGQHSVTLTTPGGCYDPITFNCQVDALPDPEWDALWAEYEMLEQVQPRKVLPSETRLMGEPDVGQAGNYPNPFNPSTTIRYVLSASAPVSVRVYNMLGQEVATLVNGFQKAGEQSVVWNGTNNFGQSVASGLYFYRLQAGNTVMTRKMLLTK